MTPLQTCLRALADVLEDARETLDERGWAAFVSIACEVVGQEAATLVMAELFDQFDDEEAA